MCVILLGYLTNSGEEERSALINDCRDGFNKAVVYACKQGDILVLRAYLKLLGVDANCSAKFTDEEAPTSALVAAIKAGHKEIVRTLLLNDAKSPEGGELRSLQRSLLTMSSPEQRIKSLVCLAYAMKWRSPCHMCSNDLLPEVLGIPGKPLMCPCCFAQVLHSHLPLCIH
eukprot:m.191004 g.191004  ORF g.191004 m.191004 type:complete len:171 (+) comp14832_c0_seq2:1356-1868(+)